MRRTSGAISGRSAAGDLPFKGRNEYDLTAAILREPLIPLPPSVPPMIRAIVQRCLAKEPSQRYQQAVEVRAALEAIQSGVDSVSTPMAAEPSSWRLAVPVMIGIGAVVLIALFLLWQQRDTRSAWERVASDGRLTLTLPSEDPVFDPAISPDAKMLCYAVEAKDGRTDLFVRRVAGGAIVRVTNDDARVVAAIFT
jgi:serine/threonine protein kinase